MPSYVVQHTVVAVVAFVSDAEFARFVPNIPALRFAQTDGWQPAEWVVNVQNVLFVMCQRELVRATSRWMA